MKIDPIHLFSAAGVNVLTAKDQAERIAELETENAHLKNLLKLARGRLVAQQIVDPMEIRGPLH